MNLGGYAVKARLGQGGFGTVYLVEQEGVAYAAKLLPLERLGAWGEREVFVLTKVRHDNAVRLLGHFHYPAKAPRFFVVIMGYMEGRRLDVWARTANPSARQVVRHLLDVARALVAVHGARALHRDVMEANILVRDSDGAAVLVDFGVGSDEEVSRLTGGAPTWTAEGATLTLESRRGVTLNVLPVWQDAPIAPGQNRLVLVEAEVTAEEARGTFTLKVWEAGGTRTVTIGDVTFP